ncbi:OmpA family protein [Sulfurimonas sp.]|mgnify:CR=1 FL=1|jgi:outer membrane protein OmpA-like peptidoglycan-associated protein|uniref:OmpA family protein n=1 Tax=Sulfurimonas sp. TaxID=2022749 RepID=UPI0025F6C8C4|nr:OmpA family protein [Sulfurimonas sp.]
MKPLFILLFITLSLFADKVDFSVIVKKPFNAALFDVTEDYDRTITAVGFSKVFQKANTTTNHSYSNAFDYLSSLSSKHGSQMHLLKIDKDAKIVLSKMSSLSRFNEAVAIVKTPQDGYFIGGYTLDGSMMLMKLTANAEPIYTKIFGTKNNDTMSNLLLLRDGGVLAIGSSVTSRSSSDAIFKTGLGGSDISLTKFTKDGRQLWSKKYGTQNDDKGIDIVESRDGSLMVLSSTSYENKRDVSFMRLDENGNKLWIKYYGSQLQSDDTFIPKKIIKLKDNNFLVSLAQYNHMRQEHIRLVKFDIYQNILIDKEIFTTYPSAINDLQEFTDSTIMAVGYVKDIQNSDALAMVLSANLVLLNQEHYGDESYDSFNALSILHNSQVAVAGLHTDNKSQESNMWVTKLNSDATILEVKPSNKKILPQLKKVFNKEISSNTLTIDKDLILNLNNEKLYFSVGAYKLSKAQKKFLDTFSAKLIPFLQKNKDHIKSLEINGHTSSEWAKTNFEDGYLKNEKLSFNRSFSVLSYIFKSQNKNEQKLLSKIIKGSGFNYSKNVMKKMEEDKSNSRRVTFKIVLK